MKWSFRFAVSVLLIMSASALALRSGGRTKAPVKEGNWPAGSAEVANLPTRIGIQSSDPGRSEFYYQGDTAAFQEALEKLAAIRWPKVELIIRDGPYQLPRQGWSPPDLAGERVDWIFTLIDPPTWNRWMNDPAPAALGAFDEFRSPVPDPKLVVYIGGGGIDWLQIKLPAKIQFTDERANTNGFDKGPVLLADVYDIETSKPIPGARVAVGILGQQNTWTIQRETKTDSNGHAQLQEFAPGTFVIGAMADEYAPRTSDSAEFRGNTLKRVTIYLSRTGSVSGMVIDDKGEPLQRVKVTAGSALAADGSRYLSPDRTNTASTTDDKGRFTLNGLPGGSVRLSVAEQQHYLSDPLKMYKSPAKDVVLKMMRTGSIKGHVVTQNGDPIGRGSVFVNVPGEDRVGTWGGSMQLAEDGSFHFDRVPPGRYVISNSPAPKSMSPDAKESEVEVIPGQTVDVELRW